MRGTSLIVEFLLAVHRACTEKLYSVHEYQLWTVDNFSLLLSWYSYTCLIVLLLYVEVVSTSFCTPVKLYRSSTGSFARSSQTSDTCTVHTLIFDTTVRCIVTDYCSFTVQWHRR